MLCCTWAAVVAYCSVEYLSEGHFDPEAEPTVLRGWTKGVLALFFGLPFWRNQANFGWPWFWLWLVCGYLLYAALRDTIFSVISPLWIAVAAAEWTAAGVAALLLSGLFFKSALWYGCVNDSTRRAKMDWTKYKASSKGASALKAAKKKGQ